MEKLKNILIKTSMYFKSKGVLEKGNIYRYIFDELKAYNNTIDYNTKCVLFIENEEIRYRKSFKYSKYTVYNKYGFKKDRDEVIPYDGDPIKLKELLSEFVKGLLSNNITDKKISFAYDYDTNDSAITVSDINTAKEVDKNVIKGNKMKDVLSKMIDVNKASAVNTAKVELGKTANKLVLSKLTPQLPRMARGYADSPLAELVVGNLVAGLLMQFAPNNAKAQVVSEAMIAAGAQVAIESFDIPNLIQELLEDVDISGLNKED